MIIAIYQVEQKLVRKSVYICIGSTRLNLKDVCGFDLMNYIKH